MVVLGGGAVSYERGTPAGHSLVGASSCVPLNHARWVMPRRARLDYHRLLDHSSLGGRAFVKKKKKVMARSKVFNARDERGV